MAREQIAERRCAAQVSDPKCVFLWGFKIAFGGQRSTGFGVIYDSLDLAKKSLSKHLLMREGLKEKPKGPRPSLPHPPLSACAFLSSRALAWWGSCWLARSCFAPPLAAARVVRNNTSATAAVFASPRASVRAHDTRLVGCVSSARCRSCAPAYAWGVAVGADGARLLPCSPSAVRVFWWVWWEIGADRREWCVGSAGKLARKASKERKNKVLKVRGKAKAEVRSGKAVAKKKKD